MNQWVTAALIGGESGMAVRKLAEKWYNAHRPDPLDPDCWIWPAAIQREVQKFVRALRSHATHPPVLFYRRYVDQWSMGDVFDLFPRRKGKASPAIAIQYADGDLYAYSLPDRGALLKRLAAERRRGKNRVGRDERIWFADAVRDAVGSSNSWKCACVLIVAREIIGGIVDDEEVAAAIGDTADWLDPFLSHKRAARK